MGVYFARNPATNAVKIGFSATPQKRVGNGQTWNDSELILEAVLDADDPAEEKRIHAKLAKCRVRGEWFKGPEVEAMIEEVKSGGYFRDPKVKEALMGGWGMICPWAVCLKEPAEEDSWALCPEEPTDEEKVKYRKRLIKEMMSELSQLVDCPRKNTWGDMVLDNIDHSFANLLVKDSYFTMRLLAVLLESYTTGYENGKKDGRAEEKEINDAEREAHGLRQIIEVGGE